KGPLTLTPKETWRIHLNGSPHRVTRDGHDFVAVSYNFTSYLVTDPDSPGTVEPHLRRTRGTRDEPFQPPTDPGLLLQRTGYACMDENEYPLNSVFEENAYYFFDQTCDVEPPTPRPATSRSSPP